MTVSARTWNPLFRGVAAFGLIAVFSSVGWPDSLVGLPDMTSDAGAVVSLTYDGTEYVVANGDLVLGETTRWWVDGDGIEILWDPADPGTDPPTALLIALGALGLLGAGRKTRQR